MTDEKLPSADSDYLSDDREASEEDELFPTLNRVAKEVQQARGRLERLQAEGHRLRVQLDKEKHKVKQAKERIATLEAECKSLIHDLELAEREVENSRTSALITLFKKMASSQNDYLLRRVLAFEDEDIQLLHNLRDYLRAELDLRLEGELGGIVTLTEGNLDHYDVQETVDTPCKAEIIGRGILFKGHPVLRTQVEVVREGVQ